MTSTSAAGRWLFACASIVLVLMATLTPAWGTIEPFRFCFVCGERETADTIANVILFVPFGLAVGSIVARPRNAIVFGALFSTCIELTQAHFIPGRSGNLGDIVSNTAGAVIGAVVLETAAKWRDPSLELERWLAAAAVACATLVVILTGFFTAPSLPDTQWFGQWAAQFGDMGSYSGVVLDVRSAGRLIPSQRLDDGGATRRDLLSGVPLIVTAISGRPTRRIAAVFSIFDQHSRRMLFLGADGPDLGFNIGLRATDVGLIEPRLRIENALSGVREGDTITLEIRRNGHAFCVGKQPNVRCNVGFTAGTGWQLLAAFRFFRRTTTWPNFAWLAALLVPCGYWIRRPWWVIGAIVIICGAAPVVGGLVPCQPIEWLAAACGVGLGHVLRRRTNT